MRQEVALTGSYNDDLAELEQQRREILEEEEAFQAGLEALAAARQAQAERDGETASEKSRLMQQVCRTSSA